MRGEAGTGGAARPGAWALRGGTRSFAAPKISTESNNIASALAGGSVVRASPLPLRAPKGYGVAFWLRTCTWVAGTFTGPGPGTVGDNQSISH